VQAARLVPPPAHHPRLHTPVLPSGESRTLQAARLVPTPVHHPRLHTPVLPSGESRTLQAARLYVEWWDRRTDIVPLHTDPALRTIIVVIIIPTFRSRSALSI